MDKRVPGKVESGRRQGKEIRVRGLVQGVGFRPSVWRLARDCGLTGKVLNDGDGVLIHAWGGSDALEQFSRRLRFEPPPLARIDALEERVVNGQSPSDSFDIVDSAGGPVRTGIVPDAATCPACLSDIADPGNRRYRYPFTNCTHCGPRLSIIRAIPYDRAQTSMSVFPMCDACRAEYDDPVDRRFHAQPNACGDCGPRVWISGPDGQEILPENCTDPIQQAARLIARGHIVAVKGIGGFHLACNATDETMVGELRRRKRRYGKPFALMVRNQGMAEAIAQVSPAEAEAMADTAAPIVVLERRADGMTVAASVAPGHGSIGVMLPYSPLHHLLMGDLQMPIVLTSGNRSDEPQCIGNEEALDRLAKIADFWLMHDRDIVNRVDDSVIRFAAGAPRTLRRARGLAPRPMPLPDGFDDAPQVLAMGGELKATFCLVKDGQAILSQHIGDLEDTSVHDDYRHNLDLYRALYDFDPGMVAIDGHPEYLSTKWGEELARDEGCRIETVQHHHAHVAGCLVEHSYGLDEGPVLAVILDGLGYGGDGTLWGGEFLKADYSGYVRLAHFQRAPLIGGERAMREPWRNTFAFLETCLGWDTVAADYAGLSLVRDLSKRPLGTLNQMMAKGLNTPDAVSAGRLFDAAAGALGIRRAEITYEGQAAIELEALAAQAPADAGAYGHEIRDGSTVTVGWTSLWRALLDDLAAGREAAVIARRFHNGVAGAVSATVMILSERETLDTVVLSGGVFQNRLLLEAVSEVLEGNGLKVLSPVQAPANDGGLALGQAAIVAARAIRNPTVA